MSKAPLVLRSYHLLSLQINLHINIWYRAGAPHPFGTLIINIIKNGDVNIVVDFAHTPDGLEKVLETAKDLAKGKIVAIFGCGGNRDRLKRPIMGEIASRYADEVILTSDNPRYETPIEIIKEIKKGVNGDCLMIENRKEAIEYALKNFVDNETIIIAGKGAEKYQEINGVKYPYNDFDVIEKFLKNNK